MPYCPRCGDEFQPHIQVCPDCRVALNEQPPKVLKMKSAPLKLVTVGIYDQAEEAEVNRLRLEKAGIQVWTIQGHIYNDPGFIGIAPGRTKLRVEERLAEKALQLLQPEPVKPAEPRDISLLICLKCGSSRFAPANSGFQRSFLSLLMAGLPLPFLSKKWKCQVCGHVWQAEDQ